MDVWLVENRLKIQVMIATRGLLILFFIWSQVDCEPTGATEESCGDIFPMHYSDNNKTMFQDSFVCNLDNLASLGFTKCFELIVEGYENMSNFTYNCGQSYNGKL